jgi:hypothetical protein
VRKGAPELTRTSSTTFPTDLEPTSLRTQNTPCDEGS